MSDNPVLRRALPGGAWSIVAPRRSARPQPAPNHPEAAASHCHFCPGNEGETEPEVYALRKPGSRRDAPGWSVRVVPNKYPALVAHADGPSPEPAAYAEINAVGLHEVIVETPDHDRRLAALTPDEIADVLSVYRARLQAASRRRDVRSVAIFRNEGRAAGASQEHAHAQLLALPIVPARLKSEIRAAAAYLRRHGRCVSCDAIKRESAAGDRVIAENADFLAFACFSPRFPFETWILPRRHQHDFRSAGRRQLPALASILSAVLKAMRSILHPFPYNLVLHTAPVKLERQSARAFHWRLEVVPRLLAGSGFELGSGVFIVSISPEETARRLRAAISGAAPPTSTRTKKRGTRKS